ncbi:ExbD/TolR family protein [Aestuariivita boseongensis]|uniref:ExbD/TolR family protein n=1 Tax=Aestuariivita boseongensis TaxID=1470562 RepID=UPI0006824B38|nr:biopolymer transporter ExbD [Aestuariivita boseongensis]
MNFAPTRPARRPAENIVPMINVVFLLLIFFLMTAQITAPLPFDVTPPASDSEALAEGPQALHISADGQLFFDGAEDDAVWPGLAALPPDTPLMIRADAGFSAAELAAILTRLTGLGITRIALVTEGGA